MYLIGYPLLAIIQILHSLLFIYTLIIIASAVISWLDADPRNRLVQIINQLTWPYYRWIRGAFGKFMPTSLSHLDLTPLVGLLFIHFIKLGILPSLTRFAEMLL